MPGEEADAEGGPGEAPEGGLEAERRRASACEERLRRAMADLDNLEKKAARDVQARADAAVDGVLLDVVGVREDLARARDALPPGGGADGVGMVLGAVDAILGRHGVEPVEAEGAMFDPGLHEAVATVDGGGLAEGAVRREVRKGYMVRGRLLRPALVEIAGGE